MRKRYHITLGAPTTAGGKVITASALMSIDGARIALEGDKVSCPACNAEGTIRLDGARLSERYNDRQVALCDDLCACNCNPPPRLINSQTHKHQIIDPEHAAAAIPMTRPATASDGAIPLRLLHPHTREPLSFRPYKLELSGKVLEGRTDGEGCTQPLSAAERASLLAWHVDDISPA
jgi:uncharacterized Zn-binding protein involved in type VI secretion